VEGSVESVKVPGVWNDIKVITLANKKNRAVTWRLEVVE
jgi:hypothetical protein